MNLNLSSTEIMPVGIFNLLLLVDQPAIIWLQFQGRLAASSSSLISFQAGLASNLSYNWNLETRNPTLQRIHEMHFN